jgi:hypothetical protein
MVVASARAFGGTLAEAGFPLSTDGTDRPVVVDLRGAGIDGAGAAAFLAARDLVANKRPLPDDSDGRLLGIRLGTASGVSRGLGPEAFDEVGGLVVRGLRLAAAGAAPDSVDGQEIWASACAHLDRGRRTHALRDDGTPAPSGVAGRAPPGPRDGNAAHHAPGSAPSADPQRRLLQPRRTRGQRRIERPQDRQALMRGHRRVGTEDDVVWTGAQDARTRQKEG